MNKTFLFIYRTKEGKYSHIEVLFKPKHFRHLTGNEKSESISSIHFYSKCIDNTLSVDDLHKGNMMELKLDILPMLMQIHKTARMIGDSDGAIEFRLSTEKFIGHMTDALVLNMMMWIITLYR